LGSKCFKRDKQYRTFPGKFPENLEIVGVLESKPFNLKTSGIPGRNSNLVMKLPVKHFWYYHKVFLSSRILEKCCGKHQLKVLSHNLEASS